MTKIVEFYSTGVAQPLLGLVCMYVNYDGIQVEASTSVKTALKLVPRVLNGRRSSCGGTGCAQR